MNVITILWYTIYALSSPCYLGTKSYILICILGQIKRWVKQIKIWCVLVLFHSFYSVPGCSRCKMLIKIGICFLMKQFFFHPLQVFICGTPCTILYQFLNLTERKKSEYRVTETCWSISINCEFLIVFSVFLICSASNNK